MRRPRIDISLPQKLMLTQAGHGPLRVLILGHLMLATNPMALFFGTLPVAGLLGAGVAFGIARFRANVLFDDAVRFSLKRLLFSLMLLIALMAATHATDAGTRILWLMLFIQTPLSFFDAWCLKKRRLGPQLFEDISFALRAKTKRYRTRSTL